MEGDCVLTTEHVTLSEDEKAVLLGELKDLHFATGMLFDWIKKDTLSKEMAPVLLGNIEAYFVKTAKMLGYESHLEKEREERFVEIRKANQKVHELEEQLAFSRPIDGLRQQLSHLDDIVREWWGKEGFHYVSEFGFYGSGIAHVKFGFMLYHISSFSKTPVTDRADREQYVEDLQELGYEIVGVEKGEYNVLDTPNNRKLLTELLTARFPSIRIHSFANHALGKGNMFELKHIETTILDLKDIPQQDKESEPIE